MRNTIGNKIIINLMIKVFITEITHISSNQIEVLPVNQLDIDTELPVDVTICSGLIKLINMNGCFKSTQNWVPIILFQWVWIDL